MAERAALGQLADKKSGLPKLEKCGFSKLPIDWIAILIIKNVILCVCHPLKLNFPALFSKARIFTAVPRELKRNQLGHLADKWYLITNYWIVCFNRELLSTDAPRIFYLEEQQFKLQFSGFALMY